MLGSSCKKQKRTKSAKVLSRFAERGRERERDRETERDRERERERDGSPKRELES